MRSEVLDIRTTFLMHVDEHQLIITSVLFLYQYFHPCAWQSINKSPPVAQEAICIERNEDYARSSKARNSQGARGRVAVPLATGTRVESTRSKSMPQGAGSITVACTG